MRGHSLKLEKLGCARDSTKYFLSHVGMLLMDTSFVDLYQYLQGENNLRHTSIGVRARGAQTRAKSLFFGQKLIFGQKPAAKMKDNIFCTY